jgi:opacity protein-like surface antigen
MHRKAVITSALLVLALTTTAVAQNPGLPVINSGVSTGLTLSGDVGFPSDDAGGGTAFGLTGKVGLGPLGVSASVSRWKPDGFDESNTSLGGTVNLKLFGGPLIPFAVTAQAGAARTKIEDVSIYHFPIGVSFSARIPTTVIGIKPWVAPRIDIMRISAIPGLPGSDSETESNFGFSAGVDLNLLSGLGFHVAYDYVKFEGGSDTIFGVGLHYGLNIPGL